MIAYTLHLMVMVCLYIILGLTLNLIAGYAGMLSLCHASFFGIGAYASALLITSAGWPFVPSLLAAVLICGLIAYLISIPLIRLQGDFFVLATLAFQIIVFAVLCNWTSLTNGFFGISGIPRPSLFRLSAISPWSFFLLSMCVALAVWMLMWRLSHSPYGRAIEATRDDELAAQALGKDVKRFKRSAFTIGGMLAAFAGVLFAGYMSYIDPTSFTLDESVFILCVVVIGGAGNLRGPIVGALVLVLLPKALRPMPGSLCMVYC
jgi:branched-chain amino acid transport system permease protein